MKPQHLSVRVTDEQKHALEMAAARNGTTVGALVRRAVSNLLGGQSVAEPPRHVPKRIKGLSREREMAWLSQHRPELGHLRGHYLVLEGSALIAHGPDLKLVIEEARAKGVSVPFVERVSDREDVPDYWMGL